MSLLPVPYFRRMISCSPSRNRMFAKISLTGAGSGAPRKPTAASAAFGPLQRKLRKCPCGVRRNGFQPYARSHRSDRQPGSAWHDAKDTPPDRARDVSRCGVPAPAVRLPVSQGVSTSGAAGESDCGKRPHIPAYRHVSRLCPGLLVGHDLAGIKLPRRSG
jgi:hypothetical protein